MSDVDDFVAVIHPTVLHEVELWNFLTLYLNYQPSDPELWEIIHEETSFITSLISEKETQAIEAFNTGLEERFICGVCGHTLAVHDATGCKSCREIPREHSLPQYLKLR
jgi:rubrerythrin